MAARSMDPDSRALRLEARRCAGHLRLALRRHSWRGAMGNWGGAGTGSSIDFQDHRPYVPGDDPRYIDWAAYARSGQTIMKLYREEVSPRLDLILDMSPSMVFRPEKREQTLRLFFFCAESALAIGAAPRLMWISGGEVGDIPPEDFQRPDWAPPETPASADPPALERLPLRGGSLRILVSDLLFPLPPPELLRPLTARKGRGLLLVPYVGAEERPGWSGNMELIDCERGVPRRQRVTPGLLKRYRDAYDRHVEAWRADCRRYEVRYARVPGGMPLSTALETEALSGGAVEPWG